MLGQLASTINPPSDFAYSSKFILRTLIIIIKKTIPMTYHFSSPKKKKNIRG